MADNNGSSRWNGNYGAEETARRAGYDKLKTMMTVDSGMKSKGFRRTLKDQDMSAARDVSTAVRKRPLYED